MLVLVGYTWPALMVLGQFKKSWAEGITMLFVVAFPILSTWYVNWNPWSEPDEPGVSEGEEGSGGCGS